VGLCSLNRIDNVGGLFRPSQSVKLSWFIRHQCNQSTEVSLELVHWGLHKPLVKRHVGPLGSRTGSFAVCKRERKCKATRALCFANRKVFGFILPLLSVPTAWEHAGIGFRVAQLGTKHVPVANLSDQSHGLGCLLHVCTCRVLFKFTVELE
jgi:hypothetical protein